MKASRIGDWICTATGLKYWPLDPRWEEVDIRDIALALSKLCRYGGHCADFYSVAEHSVLVSYVLPPRLAFCGLMHDATEAYMMDLPRPVKRHMPIYRAVEHQNWMAIAWRFPQLPATLPQGVHEADNAVLLAEKPVLMPYSPKWDNVSDAAPADVPIRCWDHETAALQFLARFHELTEGFPHGKY